MSIFSSFSSSKSFRSRTSASRTLTLSSRLSVYPLGNARRLSLSLVLHSNPTLAHCVQHGRIPSHRIFLLLQRSQAWAIRLWVLVPTLMTFIGRMPGILGGGQVRRARWIICDRRNGYKSSVKRSETEESNPLESVEFVLLHSLRLVSGNRGCRVSWGKAAARLMLTTLASHFSHVARKSCMTMQNVVAQRSPSHGLIQYSS